MKLRAFIACAVVAAAPVFAEDWRLPAGARVTTDRVSALDSYATPVGVFGANGTPMRMIEGPVRRRSWRIDGGASTTLQILDPLRQQLDDAGFQIVFECRDRECGGFDFRFDVEVVPAPGMVVDIGDYRFLSAIRGGDEVVTVLVSTVGGANYLQLVEVNAPDAEVTVTPAIQTETDIAETVQLSGETDLIAKLLAQGRVVLSDLEFQTGSADLAQDDATSLGLMAAFLNANESYRLALVGHSDTVGALQDNIDLSRRRAASVRLALMEAHGVDGARLEADGVGYLAPLTTNLTPEGRQANRRVEAVLLVK